MKTLLLLRLRLRRLRLRLLRLHRLHRLPTLSGTAGTCLRAGPSWTLSSWPTAGCRGRKARSGRRRSEGSSSKPLETLSNRRQRETSVRHPRGRRSWPRCWKEPPPLCTTKHLLAVRTLTLVSVVVGSGGSSGTTGRSFCGSNRAGIWWYLRGPRNDIRTGKFSGSRSRRWRDCGIGLRGRAVCLEGCVRRGSINNGSTTRTATRTAITRARGMQATPT
mmetsp:Transcript_54026/g.100846  ORF Transcript_54026/g.100846 Transcript_54026/m.100846 type:complete len:219 (+) Transcript_54026:1843-2499(+)